MVNEAHAREMINVQTGTGFFQYSETPFESASNFLESEYVRKTWVPFEKEGYLTWTLINRIWSRSRSAHWRVDVRSKGVLLYSEKNCGDRGRGVVADGIKMCGPLNFLYGNFKCVQHSIEIFMKKFTFIASKLILYPKTIVPDKRLAKDNSGFCLVLNLRGKKGIYVRMDEDHSPWLISMRSKPYLTQWRAKGRDVTCFEARYSL